MAEYSLVCSLPPPLLLLSETSLIWNRLRDLPNTPQEFINMNGFLWQLQGWKLMRNIQWCDIWGGQLMLQREALKQKLVFTGNLSVHEKWVLCPLSGSFWKVPHTLKGTNWTGDLWMIIMIPSQPIHNTSQNRTALSQVGDSRNSVISCVFKTVETGKLLM